jgi:hypothetical protein
MPPKTHFTIPMGDAVEVVTKSRRSKREVRTTEKVAPVKSSKQKKSGQALGTRFHTVTTESEASGQASPNTEEVHTLQLIEAQEDDIQDFETVEERHSQSKVNTRIISIWLYLIICRHKWING